MTYNIYKNEFTPSFIEYIKSKYQVIEETNNILTLDNVNQFDCIYISECMYKELKDCKKHFIDMHTMDEEIATLKDAMKDMSSQMKDTLIKFVNSPAFKGGEVMSEKDMKIYRIYTNIALLLENISK